LTHNYASDILGCVKSMFLSFFLSKLSAASGMNHIEAAILDRVAQLLYPDLFLRLDRYNEQYKDFVDETITVFDLEIQFYIAFREHVVRFESSGLHFCYPRITTAKEIYDDQRFDLALARKLLAERSQIVCNDFDLKGEECILSISGPEGRSPTFWSKENPCKPAMERICTTTYSKPLAISGHHGVNRETGAGQIGAMQVC
jgi:hypothetical protein